MAESTDAQLKHKIVINKTILLYCQLARITVDYMQWLYCHYKISHLHAQNKAQVTVAMTTSPYKQFYHKAQDYTYKHASM